MKRKVDRKNSVIYNCVYKLNIKFNINNDYLYYGFLQHALLYLYVSIIKKNLFQN